MRNRPGWDQLTPNLRWRLARSRRKAERRKAACDADITAIRRYMAEAGIKLLPWQYVVLDRAMDVRRG